MLFRSGLRCGGVHGRGHVPAGGYTDLRAARGRILTRDWDLYDTRNVVYRPARLTPDALKKGYDWAYREFYRWPSIARASLAHESVKHQAKHFFYAAGWKKFEPLWDLIIRARQLRIMTPMLEGVLSKVTAGKSDVSEHYGRHYRVPVFVLTEETTRTAAHAR